MTTPSDPSATPTTPATPSSPATPTNPAASAAAPATSAPAAATPPASAPTAATNPAVNPAAAATPQTPASEGTAPAVAADTNPAAGGTPQGAPVTYEFKQPETGLQLEGATLEEFAGVARELGLTNEGANKVAELFRSRFEAENLARVDSMAQEWATQTKSDREIGGAHLPETLTAARKALTLGAPEFAKLLAPISEGGTGIGAHPEVIRFLARVGKALGEDKFVAAKGAATTPAMPGDFARRLYPSAT